MRAFVSVAEADECIGEFTNAGSAFEVSIGDTAATIAEVMGADIEIVCDEQRIRPANSEVERLFASNDKLHKLTGWQPKYGGLDGFKKGLTKTAEWFANADNLSMYKADQYNI